MAAEYYQPSKRYFAECRSKHTDLVKATAGSVLEREFGLSKEQAGGAVDHVFENMDSEDRAYHTGQHVLQVCTENVQTKIIEQKDLSPDEAIMMTVALLHDLNYHVDKEDGKRIGISGIKTFLEREESKAEAPTEDKYKFSDISRALTDQGFSKANIAAVGILFDQNADSRVKLSGSPLNELLSTLNAIEHLAKGVDLKDVADEAVKKKIVQVCGGISATVPFEEHCSVNVYNRTRSFANVVGLDSSKMSNQEICDTVNNICVPIARQDVSNLHGTGGNALLYGEPRAHDHINKLLEGDEAVAKEMDQQKRSIDQLPRQDAQRRLTSNGFIDYVFQRPVTRLHLVPYKIKLDENGRPEQESQENDPEFAKCHAGAQKNIDSMRLIHALCDVAFSDNPLATLSTIPKPEQGLAANVMAALQDEERCPLPEEIRTRITGILHDLSMEQTLEEKLPVESNIEAARLRFRLHLANGGHILNGAHSTSAAEERRRTYGTEHITDEQRAASAQQDREFRDRLPPLPSKPRPKIPGGPFSQAPRFGNLFGFRSDDNGHGPGG